MFWEVVWYLVGFWFGDTVFVWWVGYAIGLFVILLVQYPMPVKAWEGFGLVLVVRFSVCYSVYCLVIGRVWIVVYIVWLLWGVDCCCWFWVECVLCWV